MAARRPGQEGRTIALNPERVGHAYPASIYEVSRVKVREYARATGVPDPTVDAAGRDLPAARVAVPPTFAACCTVGDAVEAILADDELGAHPNLLHSAQSYEFARSLRVGDVLGVHVSVADVVSRGRMERLTVRVRCVDAADGSDVVTGESTIVFLEERA